MKNTVDSDLMYSVVPDRGLHYLLGLVCPKIEGKNGKW